MVSVSFGLSLSVLGLCSILCSGMFFWLVFVCSVVIVVLLILCFGVLMTCCSVRLLLGLTESVKYVNVFLILVCL